MFTKIDKKILIILAIAFVIILALGFLVYKYLNFSGVEVENSAGGVKTESELNKGAVTVCLDECGNGKCQKLDPGCDVGSLNCICAETPQDCPQDCK